MCQLLASKELTIAFDNRKAVLLKYWRQSHFEKNEGEKVRQEQTTLLKSFSPKVSKENGMLVGRGCGAVLLSVFFFLGFKTRNTITTLHTNRKDQ